MSFKASLDVAEELLGKAKKLEKGVTLSEAGISTDWVSSYAEVAERAERSRKFGISRYPYEAGPTVHAFRGGFLDHKDWPLRRGLEKQGSMRSVAEYECKYVNAAGYWASFRESAIELRAERLSQDRNSEAEMLNVW